MMVCTSMLVNNSLHARSIHARYCRPIALTQVTLVRQNINNDRLVLVATLYQLGNTSYQKASSLTIHPATQHAYFVAQPDS